MSSPTTLVIGASGQIGSALVEQLRAAGQQVRALSSRAGHTERPGLRWVQADLFGGAALQAAFAGVDQAFLLAPPGHVPQHELLLPAIAAAREQGLKKLVLMTAMGADADPNSPFSIAERALRESGLAWNVIRPNWFMQNFASYWLHGIQTAGAIQVPAGTAATSFIDTRDIAAVAARLLSSEDQAGQAFDLTGPQALTHAEVAEALSRVAGRAIRYENIAPAVLRQGLLAAGLREDYSDFLLLILGYLAAGYSARVSDAVPRLLGRPAIGFARYAQEHRAVWAAA